MGRRCHRSGRGRPFKGHVKRNQRGPTYWTECKVTVCEPNEEFGFAVMAGGKTVNNWGYQLEAADRGTDVTEYFHLVDSLPTRIYWALLGWARGKTNRNGMRSTLEAIKAVVEKD